MKHRKLIPLRKVTQKKELNIQKHFTFDKSSRFKKVSRSLLLTKLLEARPTNTKTPK
jgi:hypothetical protein